MFEEAARALPSIVLERSVVIGDTPSDMEAARRIGARAILIDAPRANGMPTSSWRTCRRRRGL